MSEVDELFWEDEAHRMSAKEFATAHPHWFIAYDEPDDDEDLGFRTEVAGLPPDAKRVIFAPILKRAGNPYADRISVGRARNSDVVVRHSSVSKLHAHFRETEGTLTVTDVGSHNGTRIEGAVLAPHHPQVVSSGALILFGRLPARVLSAAAAHDLLRRR